MPTRAGGELQGMLLRDRRNAENAQAMEMARYRQAQMESMANRDRALNFQNQLAERDANFRNQLAERRTALEEAQFERDVPYRQAQMEHLQSQNKAINFQNTQAEKMARWNDVANELGGGYGMDELMNDLLTSSNPEFVNRALKNYNSKAPNNLKIQAIFTDEPDYGVGKDEIGLYYGEKDADGRPITVNIPNPVARIMSERHRTSQMQEEKISSDKKLKMLKLLGDRVRAIDKAIKDAGSNELGIGGDSTRMKQLETERKAVNAQIEKLGYSTDIEGNILDTPPIAMPSASNNMSVQQKQPYGADNDYKTIKVKNKVTGEVISAKQYKDGRIAK